MVWEVLSYLKDNEILISSIAGLFAIVCSLVSLFKNFAFVPKGSSDKTSAFSFLPFVSVFSKLSWKKAKIGARKIAKELFGGETHKSYIPTVIVGIGRGGAAFGALLSYNLNNVPLAVLERKYVYENGVRKEFPLFDIHIPKELLQRVLLVAGESHTGETMKCLNQYMTDLGAQEVRHAVFYQQDNPNLPIEIHYMARTGKSFNLMPWQEPDSIRSSKCKEESDRQLSFPLAVSKDVPKRTLTQNEHNFFYVVRHAVTSANSDGDKFIGTTEAVLNLEGKKQAAKVGGYLKGRVDVDYIFTSPMIRCIESASIISSIAGGQVKIVDDLKEMDYGDWENIKRADIIANDTENYHNYISRASFKVPGSNESPEDVTSRVLHFINNVLRPQVEAGKRVVVVTHKTSGRILLMNLLPKFVGGYREIKMGNASISKVNYVNGEYDVEFENHQGHLRWLSE